MQKVRITRDSQGRTTIVEEETGVHLENCTTSYAISYDARENELPTAVLRVYAPSFDLICGATIVRCDGEGKPI